MKNRKKGLKSLSPHILATERWVVCPPADKARAFFKEGKAMRIAAAIAARTGENVAVEHQVLNDQSQWVEAAD